MNKENLHERLKKDLKRYKSFGTPFTGDMANHLMSITEQYAQEYAEGIIGNDVWLDWYGFDELYPIGTPLRQEAMVYYKDTNDAQNKLREQQRKFNKEKGGKL